MRHLLLTLLVATAVLMATPASAFADRRDTSRRDGDRHSGSSARDHHSDRDRHSGRGPSHREERKYIPGYWEVRTVRVWIPERWVDEVLPAIVETRRVVVYDPQTGRSWEEYRTVVVRPETVVRRCIPGYWDTRTERVWVPGKWIVIIVRL